MKKIVFLILIYLSLLSLPNKAPALTEQQQQELNPGKVFYAPLADFAAPRDQKPYNLLESGHDKEAAQGFERKLAANKNDLVAFVGLAQADPSVWPSLVTRLEHQEKSENSYNLDFKLGVLYLYQWKTDRSTYPKQLFGAQKLLTRSWQQSKQPIIGLLYAQMQNMSAPGVTEISRVLDQLVLELAGPQAASFYRHARHFDWQAATPPVQETPIENLKPLRSLLKLAWSYSGTQMGHGVMHGNNIVPVLDPLTAEQEKNMAYLLKWRQAVDKAIAEHKLS